MADGKEYLSCPDQLGNIHISEDVLAVTAAAAVLEVEGVGALAANLGSDIAGMLAGRKSLSKGVRVTMEGGTVSMDISLLVKYGSNVQDTAKAAQNAVATAIANASGFTVDKVNIHVVGVAFPSVRK